VSTTETDSEPTISIGRRRLIACAMTTAAAIQGMDTFATAVALPEIRGNMSATLDEAAWVLTSFLVASAIFTPLFAWLSKRFGQRRLLILITTAFLVCTLLVAQANTLGELVFYRFMQGVTAAGMGPLSHQVMLGVYPRSQYGTAISWLTAGRMSGVMIGPLIGGILTEYLSWRWIYLSNIPLCILGLYLIIRFVPEAKAKDPPKFDFFGFIALSVAIGALQLFLDRGERLEWFDSAEIVIWAGLFIAALYLFVVHVTTQRNTYVNPQIFLQRDFLIGFFFIIILSIMIMGFAGLLPSVLQNHMDYPVSTAGILIMPRGIGTLIATMIAGPLMMRIHPRPIIIVGILCMAVSTWQMSEFTREVDAWTIGLIVTLQGAGFGFFSVAVTSMAFQTLTPLLRPDGTSMLSLARRIGSSVGVSILVSQLVRSTQENRSALMEHISPYNELLRGAPIREHWDINTLRGLGSLQREIEQQAEFMAYLHDFRLMTVLILLLLPLVFLMRGQPPPEK
jgi:DHA2 family multidrug resistance protein